MIQSFIVYTLFALALFVCARGVSCKQVHLIETRGKVFSMPSNYWWCIFIFALVAGMRYDVGVDHLSYLEDYIRALNGKNFIRDRGYEEGYVFITSLFGELGIHPVIYFAFLSALQLGFVLLAYKTERAMVPWMLMFIVLGGDFFSWMNGIRQMIAACVFVYSTQFIRDKKLVKYLLCIAFAYLWHHSSLILVPVYFFAYDKSIWSNSKINFTIFIACIILGNTPLWISSVTSIGFLISALGYEMYADNLETLTDLDELAAFTLGPRLIATLATYVLVIWLYPKVRNYFNSRTIDIIFKLFLIGACAYGLFASTSLVFRRPVAYFTIFTLPAVGYSISYLHSMKKNVLLIILLLASLSFTYLSCYIDSGKPRSDRGSYLYEFYFDKMN